MWVSADGTARERERECDLHPASWLALLGGSDCAARETRNKTSVAPCCRVTSDFRPGCVRKKGAGRGVQQRLQVRDSLQCVCGCVVAKYGKQEEPKSPVHQKGYNGTNDTSRCTLYYNTRQHPSTTRPRSSPTHAVTPPSIPTAFSIPDIRHGHDTIHFHPSNPHLSYSVQPPPSTGRCDMEIMPGTRNLPPCNAPQLRRAAKERTPSGVHGPSHFQSRAGT